MAYKKPNYTKVADQVYGNEIASGMLALFVIVVGIVILIGGACSLSLTEGIPSIPPIVG